LISTAFTMLNHALNRALSVATMMPLRWPLSKSEDQEQGGHHYKAEHHLVSAYPAFEPQRLQ
jgi:hypothetical protein